MFSGLLFWAALLASGCDSSRAISVDSALAADAAVDPGRDSSAADMNLSFPGALEGVWLVGWSGGANHYSWVRFSRMATRTMDRKDAWILAGKNVHGNLPFFDCSGKTGYWMGAAGRTVYLDFPSPSCKAGKKSMGLVFSAFTPGSMKGSILKATIKDQAVLQELEGHKFPDSWCDAAMSTCKAPF